MSKSYSLKKKREVWTLNSSLKHNLSKVLYKIRSFHFTAVYSKIYRVGRDNLTGAHYNIDTLANCRKAEHDEI